ncbi:MAG: hypothetical protein CL671_05660 [Balneola sp.]|jgi:hypothetical protein|nr:hypothetical protein [Balneola sp.]MAO78077.1 hypothetical protein [Balneola sp.]MBF64078.1 hypothetical protein [Balneola sp.]
MTASKQKCPRCKKGFECKANSISECQCSTVTLTEENRAFISNKFEDCLCVECLKEIKAGKDNFKLPR